MSRKTIIETATAVLRAGGLVIFPTETVYGAGVDATNPAAVEKLLAYKSRREGKPLSIAVTDKAMAEQYVEVNKQAAALYQQFLPGPYTIVSNGRGTTAAGVESEFGTLGVRIPDYPLILELVAALGKPITATSANGSGKRRPYTIEHILDNLSASQKKRIDLIIDVGELPQNDPSVVIDTTLSTPVVMRSSALKTETAELTLTSQSEAETQGIAGKLMLKQWEALKKTGLIITLDGSLGAGKTVFAKGIAHFLQISEVLTSPTYGYLESYDWHRHGVSGRLHHFDFWKLDSAPELERLEIPTLFGPGQLLVIEWPNTVGRALDELAQTAQIPVLSVLIEDQGIKNQRQILIHTPQS